MPTVQDQIIDAAQSLSGDHAPAEKRGQKRYPYNALVALVLIDPNGLRTRPMVLQAGDISAGGLLVISGEPLPATAQGVLQLVRSNRQFALVGVQVKHSRPADDTTHRAGLEFIGLPPGFTREEFLDASGHMMLLDPLLRRNLG